MTTIADLKDIRRVTSDLMLKAVVVIRKGPNTYSNDKTMLTVGLADGTAAAKCLIYDPTQFQRFLEGRTVVLRNFIKREDGTIVITRNSRSFLSADIPTSEEHRQAARALVDPPPAALVTLEAGLASPPRTMVSIQGMIVQEDQEKEVSVMSTPTKVKDIYLQDTTVPKCKVTLWREASNIPYHPGDYIKITDVVTNHYKGDVSFSLTARSTVQSTEPPVRNVTVLVVGLANSENTTDLLTDGGEEFTVDTTILHSAIPTEEMTPEEWMQSSVPFSVTLDVRGSTVERIRIL